MINGKLNFCAKYLVSASRLKCPYNRKFALKNKRQKKLAKV